MKPQRIQLRRTKGWKLPPNTVKVDRSTIYGNPYYVAKEPDPSPGKGIFFHCVHAETAVAMFRRAIDNDFEFLSFREDGVAKLRGKNLACWCKPGDPCHADVLLEIANR